MKPTLGRRNLLGLAVLLAGLRPAMAQRDVFLTWELGVDTLDALGGIVDRARAGRPIQRYLSQQPGFLVQTATREVVLQAAIEPLRLLTWAPNQQVTAASLRYSDGQPIDPSQTPYFTLPGPGGWLSELGVELGDYGAVVYRGMVTFAVFGQLGASGAFVQGSPALMRLLGAPDMGRRDVYLKSDAGPQVVVVVFPGSGSREDRSDASTLSEAISAKGPKRFQIAGGRVGADRVTAEQRRPAMRIVRVLWVDDVPDNNVSETAALRRMGVEVRQVVSTEQALSALQERQDWDLVISDIARGSDDTAGVAFAKQLRARNLTYNVVFYTSSAGRARFAAEAERLGARTAVTPQELLDAVRSIGG